MCEAAMRQKRRSEDNCDAEGAGVTHREGPVLATPNAPHPGPAHGAVQEGGEKGTGLWSDREEDGLVPVKVG